MDTRTCKRCNETKDISEFYEMRYMTKKGETRCRAHTCSGCYVKKAVDYKRKNWNKFKGYQRKFYNSEETKTRQAACRDRLKAMVDKLKDAPCADCGRTFPPVCMDFDHIDPETKFNSVSQLVAKRRRWEVIQQEISKCQLVCANCHRIRTDDERTKLGGGRLSDVSSRRGS